MKTISSVTFSAALIVCSLSLAQAAPKSKDISPETDARAMLVQVDALSNEMASTADRLAIGAKSQDHADAQLAALDVLRGDINQIGRDLRVLTAEEDTLPAWESKAIDEVLPLMNEIASNTEQAVQNFNANRNHLWATDFPNEASKVYVDAERVKEVLDGNLKLAAARDEERRIENTLNQ